MLMSHVFELLEIINDIQSNNDRALSYSNDLPEPRGTGWGSGDLISYGTGLRDAYRRAGIYAGRIVKGESPADLPVQQSTKVLLSLNLNVARCFCTQIGNDHFTWFGTTGSKSRLNFLQVLRAGHSDYVINDEAIAYMRERALAGPVIARLLDHPHRYFAGQAVWNAHLDALDISALRVTPDPVLIATEGALWGSIKARGFLPDAVIVSDDAGQLDVGLHALCWIHTECLVHKLDTFTDEHRAAQSGIRDLIWTYYRRSEGLASPTDQAKQGGPGGEIRPHLYA
jgi:hypothetical protein